MFTKSGVLPKVIMFPYIMLKGTLDENELVKNPYTYDIVTHFKNPINF